MTLIIFSTSTFGSEFRVEKGWNLVNPYFLEELDSFNENNIFIFENKEKKYYNYNEFSEAAKAGEFADDGTYFNGISIWYYSEVEDSFDSDFKIQDFNTLIETQLYQGWNFLSVNGGMLTSLKEYKGTCNIEKVLTWVNQEWIIIDEAFLKSENNIEQFETMGDVVLFDNPSEIGLGFIVKVSKDCTFGKPSSVAPPQFPSTDLEKEIREVLYEMSIDNYEAFLPAEVIEMIEEEKGEDINYVDSLIKTSSILETYSDEFKETGDVNLVEINSIEKIAVNECYTEFFNLELCGTFYSVSLQDDLIIYEDNNNDFYFIE